MVTLGGTEKKTSLGRIMDSYFITIIPHNLQARGDSMKYNFKLGEAHFYNLAFIIHNNKICRDVIIIKYSL